MALAVAGVVVGLLLSSGCAKSVPPAAGTSSVGTDRGPAPPTSEAGAGVSGVDPGAIGRGRPSPAVASPKEFVDTPALREIHFDFDRYDIRPTDAAILEANARWLKTHPQVRLLIEGHADERGTNEYNLALGERRARAARDYLATLGVAETQIAVISYGEEQPLCTERTEECWAKNRRVQFLIKP